MSARGKKAEATSEWIARHFGTTQAWYKSRTGWKDVKRGHKRREVIHVRLMPAKLSAWRLPCPDKPIPQHIRDAVSRSVTGIGPRPRLEYLQNGQKRIAIGRRGEPADSLRAELWAIYGPLYAVEVSQANHALAEYIANGGNYRSHARALGMRDDTFLAKSADAAEVERSVLLSDWQMDRVWRLQPVYEVPAGDGDVSLGDYGDWAKDELRQEVTGGFLDVELEQPIVLPMAIPKADGRGKQSLYFGHALNYGGGNYWSHEDFETPLRIALGGLLNRQLGYGNSTFADQVLAYLGEGFHWGRYKPLAPRKVDSAMRGPVCRPDPDTKPKGNWYPWLGTVFPVPLAKSWNTWIRRKEIYDRERNKSQSGSKDAA
jgi:hypothetical protein